MSLSLASCFHEAGHAVALVVLDLPDLLGEVRVKPDTSGYTQLELHPGADSATEVEQGDLDRTLLKLAILYAAGREAQRESDPSGDETALLDSAEKDIDVSWKLIRRMSRVGQRGMPLKAEQHARALVRKHWRAISIFALHLHERGTLTGAEARDLIEAHIERKEEAMAGGWMIHGSSAEVSRG